MSACSRGCVRTASVWTPGGAIAVCAGWGSSSTPHMESASVSNAHLHARCRRRRLGNEMRNDADSCQDFLNPSELSKFLPDFGWLVALLLTPQSLAVQRHQSCCTAGNNSNFYYSCNTVGSEDLALCATSTTALLTFSFNLRGFSTHHSHFRLKV